MKDDFDRNVYCIAGLPFDAVDMEQAMTHIRDAILHEQPCFLTTPNLNFVALAQQDAVFRQSVIESDLVVADGMPIVWLAKLLGVPIRERVAGSSLFEAFRKESRRKITAYFFGGPEGAAEAACNKINAAGGGVTCVGFHSPGFGTLDDMSTPEIMDAINASKADFLVVALGAKKGQAWIRKNLAALKTPVVSHLGAVVNFEADRLKRAPAWVQNIGFEWLWRIKEEPALWKRYWNDGLFALQMLITRILPLWFRERRYRSIQASEQNITGIKSHDQYQLKIGQYVADPVSPNVRAALRLAAGSGCHVEVDLSHTQYLSSGFLGLLLMLKRHLDRGTFSLRLSYCSPVLAKSLRRHGLGYLLDV